MVDQNSLICINGMSDTYNNANVKLSVRHLLYPLTSQIKYENKYF